MQEEALETFLAQVFWVLLYNKKIGIFWTGGKGLTKQTGLIKTLIEWNDELKCQCKRKIV
jgi:hypothetical protein